MFLFFPVSVFFPTCVALGRTEVFPAVRRALTELSPPPGADGDVDAAAHFITAMFSSCGRRAAFHHYTTATDTAAVRVVLHMVVDQISKDNLASVQLL